MPIINSSVSLEAGRAVSALIAVIALGYPRRVEQQVLITETGIELLSRFPFEEALLAHN